MIKRICPRCKRVIEINQKLCTECMARSNKDYDRNRRDKTSKAFYNSNAWIKTRQMILSKYHGLDMYQLIINNKVVYADTIHHIEELRDNPSKALDPSNLIPVSSSTHSYIHKEYEKNKKEMQRILSSIIMQTNV